MDTSAVVGLALGTILLGGCAGSVASPPPSAAEFETMRNVLASNPEARAAMRSECRDEMAGRPLADRQMLGALLDIDAEQVADAFCARTLAGIARGDVSYADFIAMTGGSEDPQLMRRFIRALRLDPSAVAI